jgi:sulfide dehydrogenase cytochrome subunit
MIARLVVTALLIAAAVAGAEAASAPAPSGASSCSGCHAASATMETPVPSLTGRNPADIEAAMLAFRSGQRPASVMDRIAKGFSVEEIKAIAAWYGARK